MVRDGDLGAGHSRTGRVGNGAVESCAADFRLSECGDGCKKQYADTGNDPKHGHSVAPAGVSVG